MWSMLLPSKTITCSCGQGIELKKSKDWCDRCGRPVFYNLKEMNRHRINTYFITLMLLLGIGVFTYFFIELVMVNLLG